MSHFEELGKKYNNWSDEDMDVQQEDDLIYSKSIKSNYSSCSINKSNNNEIWICCECKTPNNVKDTLDFCCKSCYKQTQFGNKPDDKTVFAEIIPLDSDLFSKKQEYEGNSDTKMFELITNTPKYNKSTKCFAMLLSLSLLILAIICLFEGIKFRSWFVYISAAGFFAFIVSVMWWNNIRVDIKKAAAIPSIKYNFGIDITKDRAYVSRQDNVQILVKLSAISELKVQHYKAKRGIPNKCCFRRKYGLVVILLKNGQKVTFNNGYNEHVGIKQANKFVNEVLVYLKRVYKQKENLCDEGISNQPIISSNLKSLQQHLL